MRLYPVIPAGRALWKRSSEPSIRPMSRAARIWRRNSQARCSCCAGVRAIRASMGLRPIKRRGMVPWDLSPRSPSPKPSESGMKRAARICSWSTPTSCSLRPEGEALDQNSKPSRTVGYRLARRQPISTPDRRPLVCRRRRGCRSGCKHPRQPPRRWECSGGWQHSST